LLVLLEERAVPLAQVLKRLAQRHAERQNPNSQR
jgi:phosphoribosyl-ATP pyrophosphohydrolase